MSDKSGLLGSEERCSNQNEHHTGNGRCRWVTYGLVNMLLIIAITFGAVNFASMCHHKGNNVQKTPAENSTTAENLTTAEKSTTASGNAALFNVSMNTHGGPISYVASTTSAMKTTDDRITSSEPSPTQPLPVTTAKASEPALHPDQLKMALQMIHNMDRQMNPCDDFYQYACGGWMTSHSIPLGETSYDQADFRVENNELVIRDALEDLSNSASTLELKAKSYFDSCLERTDSESQKLSYNLKPHHTRNNRQTRSLTEKWRYCIKQTENLYGFVLGKLFVQQTIIHGKIRNKIEKMIRDMKHSFRERLETLLWIDHDAKKQLLQKLHALKESIGYPDSIFNDTALEEYDKSTLWFDILGLNSRDEWEDTPPQTVNAFYKYETNHMVFPAGFLQPPFYSPHFPAYINYGGIGTILGHELTHAFDNNGITYDKDGMISELLGQKSLEEFKTRTECLVDQYSQFQIDYEYVDGERTLPDNIADNGGLRTAYHAYQNWVKTSGPESPLPGLDLTPNQTFFLSYAQSWCGIAKRDYLETMYGPTHSPDKFRIQGTLVNSEDFAQAYNCPRGSKMNPSKKCDLW